jgi:hypothetical protein
VPVSFAGARQFEKSEMRPVAIFAQVLCDSEKRSSGNQALLLFRCGYKREATHTGEEVDPPRSSIYSIVKCSPM